MEDGDNIELRSDEIQELLGQTPHWMIRWGTTAIFFVVALLIFVSWLIKYPDVIEGNLKLTTYDPPIKLVNKVQGQIATIFVEEGQIVKEGEYIAEIKNPVNSNAINFLTQLVPALQKSTTGEPISLDILQGDSGLLLGDFQDRYALLKKTLLDHQIRTENEFYERKIRHLREQIAYNKNLYAITQKQIKLAEEDLKRAEVKFAADKQLYKSESISKMEFFNGEEVLNQAKNKVETVRKNEIQNQATISELKKQLNETEYEFLQTNQNFLNLVSTTIDEIHKFVLNWQQSYMIIAPIDGKVTFLKELNEKQFIMGNDELFAIVPGNNDYLGIAEIPQKGYGKVQVGQKVRIKLDNYPDYEYGQLIGKVKSISPLADEGVYMIKVALNHGMTSSYGKQLLFKPEMTGKAEIITEDLRLIQRFFNQFRKIFKERV